MCLFSTENNLNSSTACDEFRPVCDLLPTCCLRLYCHSSIANITLSCISVTDNISIKHFLDCYKEKLFTEFPTCVNIDGLRQMIVRLNLAGTRREKAFTMNQSSPSPHVLLFVIQACEVPGHFYILAVSKLLLHIVLKISLSSEALYGI